MKSALFLLCALVSLTQGCVGSGRSQSSPSATEVRIGNLTKAQAVGMATARLRTVAGANINEMEPEAVPGEHCWIVTFRGRLASPDAWFLVLVYGPNEVIVSAY